jgi:hypothetical protein
MKNLYLVLFLLAFGIACFSQSSLPQSTYAQIYNFEPGDTLEYWFRTDDEYSFDYTEGYLFYVIAGSVQDSSSVNYLLASYGGESHSSNPFHPIGGGGVSFSYPLALKDSPILFNLMYLDTACNHIDSVYANQDFNGSKQNEVSRMCFESSWQQKFVDSLGQVSYSAYHTTSGAHWSGSQQSLIYYHKANGARWGSPHYFVIQDIDNPGEEASEAVILPNPVTQTFQVHFAVLDKTVTLKLFDALGREVKRDIISSSTTTINRSGLEKGLYVWQIERDGIMIKTGKLIFE